MISSFCCRTIKRGTLHLPPFPKRLFLPLFHFCLYMHSFASIFKFFLLHRSKHFASFLVNNPIAKFNFLYLIIQSQQTIPILNYASGIIVITSIINLISWSKPFIYRRTCIAFASSGCIISLAFMLSSFPPTAI